MTGPLNLEKKARINIGKDQVCEFCDHSPEDCHFQVFGNYCVAVVVRHFKYDPLRATNESATEAFTRAYNSALDFHNFNNHDTINPTACYLPPWVFEG